MFKFLASGPSSPFLKWIEANEDPIFLSAASLVEFQAAIAKLSPGQAQRAEALHKWLDGLVSGFADRIHPIDCDIALRAGALFPLCQAGYAQHRFHDVLLVATAQIHGHGLLTKREGVFGPWTQIVIAAP